LLDAAEIVPALTQYVCNGANGAVGAQGPIGLTGATGPQGPAGVAGPQGVAGPVGATGPQGIQGVAGTNGTNGLNALVKTTVEPAGANCVAGGTKVETGLDANNNGILDLAEINAAQTTFVCNGVQGVQGIQGIAGPIGPTGATGATGPQGIQGIAGPIGLTGATGPAGVAGTAGPQGIAGTNGINGNNGFNALVKTTAEPAGANCTAGGTKVETGLDANNNGLLDLAEINAAQTTYVCNGIQGAQGIQGPTGATGPTGPAGVAGPQGIQGIAGPAGGNLNTISLYNKSYTTNNFSGWFLVDTLSINHINSNFEILMTLEKYFQSMSWTCMYADLKIEILNSQNQAINFFYSMNFGSSQPVENGQGNELNINGFHQQDPKLGQIHLWINNPYSVKLKVSINKYLTCATNYAGWPNQFNWTIQSDILIID
jgi:hypothetical protein